MENSSFITEPLLNVEAVYNDDHSAKIELVSVFSNEERLQLAVYSDQGRLTLLNEYDGKHNSLIRNIEWNGTNWSCISALSFSRDGTWLIAVTSRNVIILPYFQYMGGSILVNKPSEVWSSQDPTQIDLPQVSGYVSCCAWWKSSLNKNICIIASSRGEILFVDLDKKRCSHKIQVQGSIIKLTVVSDDRQQVTYLLVSARSNLQWKVLLEERYLDLHLRKSESELKQLGFSFYGGNMYIKSILQASLDSIPENQDFLPHRFCNIPISVTLRYQSAKSCHLISALDKRGNILKIYDSTVSHHPLYEYSLPSWSDHIVYTDNLIYMYQFNPGVILVLANQLAECRCESDQSTNQKSVIRKFNLEEDEVVLLMTSTKLSAVWYTDLVKRSESEFCTSHQHTIMDGCVIVTNKQIFHIKPHVSPEQLYLNHSISLQYDLNSLEVLTRVVPIDVMGLLTQAAQYKLAENQPESALNIMKYAKMDVIQIVELLSKSSFHQLVITEIQYTLQNRSITNTNILNTLSDYMLESLLILSQTSNEHQKLLRSCLLDNQFYSLDLATKLLVEYQHVNLLIHVSIERKFLLSALDHIYQSGLFSLVNVSERLHDKMFVQTLSDYKQGILLAHFKLPDLTQFLITLEDYNTVVIDLILPEIHLLNTDQLKTLLYKYHPYNDLYKTTLDTRYRSLSTRSADSQTYARVPMETEDADRHTDLYKLSLFYINLSLTLHSKQEHMCLQLSQIKKCLNESTQEQNMEVHVSSRPLCCTINKAYYSDTIKCYSWGSRQPLTSMKIEDRVAVSIPYNLPYIKQQVTHISCGAQHIIFMSDAQVFGYGDSMFGQVGAGESLIYHMQPEIVQLVEGVQISDIVCGRYHSLALTQTGRLYSWGWNVFGQLGVGDIENRSTPQLVEFGEEFNDHFIISASAGHAHTVALDLEGSVWVFGSNSYGQLALIGDDIKMIKPYKLELDFIVSLLSTKYFYTVAVSAVQDDGRQTIVCWGIHPVLLRKKLQSFKNEVQSSTVSSKFSRNSLQAQRSDELKGLNKLNCSSVFNTEIKQHIVQVSCGGWHVLLVTSSGTVYECDGMNVYKRVGVFEDKFSRVESTSNAVFIATDFSYSLILNSDGTIQSFGSNDRGQLGLGLKNIRHVNSLANVKLTSLKSSSREDYLRRVIRTSHKQNLTAEPDVLQLAQLARNEDLDIMMVLEQAQTYKCYSLLAVLYSVIEKWSEACFYHLFSINKCNSHTNNYTDTVLECVDYYLNQVKKEDNSTLSDILTRVLQFWQAKNLSIQQLENYLLSERQARNHRLSVLSQLLLQPENCSLVSEQFMKSLSTKFMIALTRSSLKYSDSDSPQIISPIQVLLNKFTQNQCIRYTLPSNQRNEQFGEDEMLITFSCGHNFECSKTFQTSVEEMKTTLQLSNLDIAAEAIHNIYNNHSLRSLPCPQCITRLALQVNA